MKLLPVLYPQSYPREIDSFLNDFVRNVFREEPSYPPYDVIRYGENMYGIEIAVAGFSKEDIKVEAKDNTLTIVGTKNSQIKEGEKKYPYIHQGIARRSFKLSWNLDKYAQVKYADLDDGILKIGIDIEVPEEKKPRLIPINTGE